MKNYFLKLSESNNYLLILFVLVLIFVGSCSSSSGGNTTIPDDDPTPHPSKPSFNKVASILYHSPKNDYVMVMAHRGGFVSTPENSISGIQNSINIGVDIVEMDVQLTKDGHLIIMHDATIDRTTDGSGLVSNFTLAELKKFKLTYPNGLISNEYIPSLKEVLEFSKGKMHLFIDKSDNYLDLVYADMLATNTVDQTIMGGTLFFSNYKSKYPAIWDKLNYIPRAGTGQSLTYITDFETGISPLGYFPSCELISSNSDVFKKINEFNKWNFSETLKGGGSNCSEVVLGGENIWNWEIQRGIDGIFTDKSQELINFLNKKGLHNNE